MFIQRLVCQCSQWLYLYYPYIPSLLLSEVSHWAASVNLPGLRTVVNSQVLVFHSHRVASRTLAVNEHGVCMPSTISLFCRREPLTDSFHQDITDVLGKLHVLQVFVGQCLSVNFWPHIISIPTYLPWQSIPPSPVCQGHTKFPLYHLSRLFRFPPAVGLLVLRDPCRVTQCHIPRKCPKSTNPVFSVLRSSLLDQASSKHKPGGCPLASANKCSFCIGSCTSPERLCCNSSHHRL